MLMWHTNVQISGPPNPVPTSYTLYHSCIAIEPWSRGA